jgi:hypothetical protein
MGTYFKHEITGKIAEYPDHYRNHPVFGHLLTEVPKPTRGCDDCGFHPEDVDEPAVVEQTEGVPSEQQWNTDTWNGYTDTTNDPEKD